MGELQLSSECRSDVLSGIDTAGLSGLGAPGLRHYASAWMRSPAFIIRSPSQGEMAKKKKISGGRSVTDLSADAP